MPVIPGRKAGIGWPSVVHALSPPAGLLGAEGSANIRPPHAKDRPVARSVRTVKFSTAGQEGLPERFTINVRVDVEPAERKQWLRR